MTLLSIAQEGARLADRQASAARLQPGFVTREDRAALAFFGEHGPALCRAVIDAGERAERYEDVLKRIAYNCEGSADTFREAVRIARAALRTPTKRTSRKATTTKKRK